MSQTAAGSAGWEFLVFDKVSFRSGRSAVFKNTHWTWRGGEQWAILGPDGSGKSLLVEAILGRVWPVRGEVRGPFPRPGLEEEDSQVMPTMAHVSPQIQRELAVQESAFYQLRWHSGMDQSPRTVSQFLSQDSVEDHNPFEVDARRGNRRQFLRRRRQFVDWLGVQDLWSRRLIHLSNGELRKALLIHELLKCPCLLVLEDPYSGLDASTRQKLGRVVLRLMREGWPVLMATHRSEELPAATTHLLLIDHHQVIAQGPKKQMLALWREHFGIRPSRARQKSRLRSGRPADRSRASWGQPLVELSHVTITGGKRRILHDVSWTLREGECWALLGPNGAGKTTLLNLIQGDHPQAAAQSIRVFGQGTDAMHTWWQTRQQIGWMSPELHQHYPPDWDTWEVVCSGFYNSVGLHESCSRNQRREARQWLLDLGLGKQAPLPFGELSFGQQRLVLLARAAIKQPRLLILDEPCQGLDAAQRQTLLAAVNRTVAQTGASLVFVTHRSDEMPPCISHVLRLVGGRIRNKQCL